MDSLLFNPFSPPKSNQELYDEYCTAYNKWRAYALNILENQTNPTDEKMDYLALRSVIDDIERRVPIKHSN